MASRTLAICSGVAIVSFMAGIIPQSRRRAIENLLDFEGVTNK